MNEDKCYDCLSTSLLENNIKLNGISLNIWVRGLLQVLYLCVPDRQKENTCSTLPLSQ